MTGLDAVKAATWDLHRTAERSGIIADIMAGRANRFGVALLLRNLLPVYEVLDHAACFHPALARSQAIEADLRVLIPEGEMCLLPEGAAYADRVRQTDATGLLGHSYVRYLGDLNGGRILRARLAACLGAVGHTLRFLDFPTLVDLNAFKRDYRAELDRRVTEAGTEGVAAEAVAAFKLNIALSEAVQTASKTQP